MTTTTPNTLQVLDGVTRALASIKTVEGAKKLRDEAETLRYYAKLAGKGLEAQNRCALVKFLCERRGGELLAKIERSKGGRPKGGSKKTGRGARPVSTEYQKALRTAGITRDTASNWQELAVYMTEAKLRSLAAVCGREDNELTQIIVAGYGHMEWKRRRDSEQKDREEPTRKEKATAPPPRVQQPGAPHPKDAPPVLRLVGLKRKKPAARARIKKAQQELRDQWAKERASVRELINRIRNETLPRLRELGDIEESIMSPEGGRFIAGLYRQMADVLLRKAECYDKKFGIGSD